MYSPRRNSTSLLQAEIEESRQSNPRIVTGRSLKEGLPFRREHVVAGKQQYGGAVVLFYRIEEFSQLHDHRAVY